MFQGGMRESDLKTCGIRRLDSTSTRTRSTLLSRTPEKHKHLQEGLDQMNEKPIQDQSN